MRGPTSRPIQPSGTSMPSSSRRSVSASNVAAEHQVRAAAAACSARPRPSRAPRRASSTPSSSTSESPVGIPWARKKREAHRAADQQRVGGVEEAVDQRDLVGDLGAAEHHHERALGRLDDRAQRDSPRARAAGRPPPGAGTPPPRRWRRARGGPSRTRRSRRRRPAPASSRASSGSFSVSPRSQRVFSSTSTLPGSSRSTPRRTSGRPPSGAWCDRRVDQLAEPLRDRLQRGLRVAPLGPSRGASTAPAARPRSSSSSIVGSARPDAGVVGHPAVLQRHVEVHPHEHGLARPRPRGRGRLRLPSGGCARRQATGAPASTRWARSTTRFE